MSFIRASDLKDGRLRSWSTAENLQQIPRTNTPEHFQFENLQLNQRAYTTENLRENPRSERFEYDPRFEDYHYEPRSEKIRYDPGSDKIRYDPRFENDPNRYSPRFESVRYAPRSSMNEKFQRNNPARATMSAKNQGPVLRKFLKYLLFYLRQNYFL